MVPDAMTIAATPDSPANLAGSCAANLGCMGLAHHIADGADVCLWEGYMPGRGRSSFNKRQKEISRQEKRREKAARKQQRKLEKQAALPGDAGDLATPDSPSPEMSGPQSIFATDPDISRESD